MGTRRIRLPASARPPISLSPRLLGRDDGHQYRKTGKLFRTRSLLSLNTKIKQSKLAIASHNAGVEFPSRLLSGLIATQDTLIVTKHIQPIPGCPQAQMIWCFDRKRDFFALNSSSSTGFLHLNDHFVFTERNDRQRVIVRCEKLKLELAVVGEPHECVDHNFPIRPSKTGG